MHIYQLRIKISQVRVADLSVLSDIYTLHMCTKRKQNNLNYKIFIYYIIIYNNYLHYLTTKKKIINHIF